MIYRIIVFILGIFLLSFGLSMMLIYLSLFSLGFDINEYLEYMFSNYSFYLIPIGLFLICVSLFFDNKWQSFINKRKNK